MNISHVINPKENPVNAQLCGLGYKDFVSLTNAAETAWGDVVNCEGYQSAAVVISGTFEAEVRIVGYYATGYNANLMVKNTSTGEISNKITAKGCYLVDLSGIKEFYTRVTKYTSGEVSAKGGLYVKQLHTDTFEERSDRNALLATAFGVTVPAGSVEYAVTSMIDITQYPYQYVVIRTNSGKAFSAYLYYLPKTLGGLSTPLGSIKCIDNVNTRGASEWMEARGEQVQVCVDNPGDTDQTFDVYLYGVG